MSIPRKAKRAGELERQQLQAEAFHLQCTLDELYARFDRLTDGVQVDACIYEMNACMARYDYTLKCLKALEVT